MLAPPQIALGLAVVALTAWAAVSDLRTGLIPNRVTVGGWLALTALQVALTAQSDLQHLPSALLGSLLGVLACALIPLAIYLARGLGGGDVKLFAACGAGLGPWLGLEAQLYAFGLGCVFAVGKAIYAGVLWQTLRGSTTVLANALVPARMRRDVAASALAPIRFAPFIFAGVVTAVAASWRTP